MSTDQIQPPSEVALRLVVELNRRSRADLAWVCDAEELNKTTAVNRALQVYKRLIENQFADGVTIIESPDGTQERVRFV